MSEPLMNRAGFSCTVPLETWRKLVKAAEKKGVHWTQFIEKMIEDAT